MARGRIGLERVPMIGRRALAQLSLFASVVTGAAVGACAEQPAPRFPHRTHLVTLECGEPGRPACLACSSCHTVSARDRAHQLPPDEICTRCHRDDAHEVLGVIDAEPARVSGRIRFDHARHLEMPEIHGQCVGCHAGVVEPARAPLPPMAHCFSCHAHAEEWRAGTCAPCHVEADLGRTLPQTFLRHDASFARRHGALARDEKRLCQACHAQSDCDDCHDVSQDLGIERRRPERIEQRLVHRGDFVARHAIEAESQPGRCLRCHEPASCDACHVAERVSGNRRDAPSPHRAGWVGAAAGARSSHAREARRDIASCAACHEQGPATNCIRCHRAGGPGGNPHPSGWKSAQGTASTMCRYCHG
jgi:hypothetical protein